MKKGGKTVGKKEGGKMDRRKERKKEGRIYACVYMYILFMGSQGKNTEQFAIPFSNGPHSVRPLHHDPPVLGSLTTAWLSFIELDKAVVCMIGLASFL